MQLENRHLTSGLNSRFNGGQINFSDYIVRNQDMIAQVRSAHCLDNLDKIVRGNSPFQLRPASGFPTGFKKPYKRGVLLTHGLTDSPYFMRHLATFFQECGFRVMAILLPGHGTQPGDLLNVSWHEWEKTVAYGTEQLANEVDEIYLAGYSAGGALSIYQSLNSKRVHGLFLFSPALKISSRAAWANLHKFYSWLLPSGKWVSTKPDSDAFKYESFPKNAAAQMHGLTRALHQQLQQRELDIPVFIAASEDDITSMTSATMTFMAGLRHPSSRLVLYSTNPGQYPPDFLSGKLEVVNSMSLSQRILSSAHTAIVLPPDDTHYGPDGDYSNCIHYFPDDMDKYNACINRSTEIFQGEITARNLGTGTVRRLMYNPNFASLKISLQKFIGSLN